MTTGKPGEPANVWEVLDQYSAGALDRVQCAIELNRLIDRIGAGDPFFDSVAAWAEIRTAYRTGVIDLSLAAAAVPATAARMVEAILKRPTDDEHELGLWDTALRLYTELEP